MFKRLIELIKQAIRNMVKYQDLKDTLDAGAIYTISEDMQHKIDLWKDLYKDLAPWLDDDKGIYSLGIAKQICQNLSNQVLAESEIKIHTPGVTEKEKGTRAAFLQEMFDRHIVKNLPVQLEKAMALGGMVIKPYISGDQVYLDFTPQGKFYPLQFDDDGNISDIAFLDQFTSDGKLYTKVERHTFMNNVVTVQNKVFVAPDRTDEEVEQELGIEIPIEQVEKWANIEPETFIENVDKPLFGYYKTPLSNNIDLDCPLGVSVFNPALPLIRQADIQFSRLDWEYEGGQLAIDVDVTAVRPVNPDSYYGNTFEQDGLRDRLYRKLDLGSDDTYKAFAPALRDENYLAGLNAYLRRIEDNCGLARGTISEVDTEAKTATEVKIAKQRTYITINSNQKALENALNDVIYAMNIYATLYNLAPEGEYEVSIDWSDSVLTDIDTEISQKIQLEQEGVLSKAEVRSWYLGEDIETSKTRVAEIKEEKTEGLNDIFSSARNFDSNPTLEGND